MKDTRCENCGRSLDGGQVCMVCATLWKANALDAFKKSGGDVYDERAFKKWSSKTFTRETSKQFYPR